MSHVLQRRVTTRTVLLYLDTDCYGQIIQIISHAIHAGKHERKTTRASSHTQRGTYQLSRGPISRVIQHTYRKVHQGLPHSVPSVSRADLTAHIDVEAGPGSHGKKVQEVSKHAHHSHHSLLLLPTACYSARPGVDREQPHKRCGRYTWTADVLVLTRN